MDITEGNEQYCVRASDYNLPKAKISFIRVHCCRKVEINDTCQLFNVDPTSCNIRCQKDCRLSRHKVTQGILALWANRVCFTTGLGHTKFDTFSCCSCPCNISHATFSRLSLRAEFLRASIVPKNTRVWHFCRLPLLCFWSEGKYRNSNYKSLTCFKIDKSWPCRADAAHTVTTCFMWDGIGVKPISSDLRVSVIAALDFSWSLTLESLLFVSSSQRDVATEIAGTGGCFGFNLMIRTGATRMTTRGWGTHETLACEWVKK